MVPKVITSYLLFKKFGPVVEVTGVQMSEAAGGARRGLEDVNVKGVFSDGNSSEELSSESSSVGDIWKEKGSVL